MRIAVVSDIHGNLAAFEAVLADLKQVSPDLILHGGDLAHGGSSPAEIVDRIRDLGWPGVLGNTDEMLPKPAALEEFAKPLPQFASLWSAIRDMAVVTRQMLGDERIAWLGDLPLIHQEDSLALVHASPLSCWRSPLPEASDEELESAYSTLGRPIAVYGHIHRSFVRKIRDLTVINSGSVSLSHDGDPRAAYLLLDESEPSIRRVEYPVEREIRDLRDRRIPHAEWIAKSLETARPPAL